MNQVYTPTPVTYVRSRDTKAPARGGFCYGSVAINGNGTIESFNSIFNTDRPMARQTELEVQGHRHDPQY